jgi:AraC-like DNA-binding protein
VIDFREVRLPEWSPVERIWLARGPAGGQQSASGGRETILPDGRFEVIFNFGDPVLQDGEPQPRAMLAAETRRAVTIEPTGAADFLGVTLRDARVSRAIGVPPRDVRDRMVPFADDLLERLGNANEKERVRIITNAFAEAERDALAEHAAAAIRSTHGRVSITRLARVCGVSVRTLNRAFDRSLGMTPKTLARVCRINRAASLLRDGNAAADVALDAGFCDQPHLVNEFRTIAGLSPSRWIELPPGLGVRFLQDGRDAGL